MPLDAFIIHLFIVRSSQKSLLAMQYHELIIKSISLINCGFIYYLFLNFNIFMIEDKNNSECITER